MLAGGSNIVMATVATSRNMIVIHSDNRVPNAGRVACITAVRGSHMPGLFACGCDAIVAADARFSYFIVVHCSDRYPSLCGMARLAMVRRADMVRRLPGGIGAVVARHTGLSRYSGMIELRGP